MKKHHINLTLFSILLAASLLITNIVSSQTSDEATAEPLITSNTFVTINIDGDVSLNEAENRIYWNPHSVGLTSASNWTVSFNNETQILLRTTADEAGHIATGAWWTTSFKSKTKPPLYTLKPIKFIANFRVNIATVHYEADNEWLRIALACAIQRSDGSVVYTEMDFWDSPNTLGHPSGNIGHGGNIIYRGGDVVEYKIDQAIVGQWTNYSLDLTRFINTAWLLRSGDALESVYIVIETMGTSVDIEVKIDDLWITQIE
jgi:hypothetical protein